MRSDLPGNSQYWHRLGFLSTHPRRAPWVVGTVALATFAILGGVGLVRIPVQPTVIRIPVSEVATSAAMAGPFSPEEQQIVDELPGGYTADSCTPVINPPEGAVASLTCGTNSIPNGPKAARFSLAANPDMAAQGFAEAVNAFDVASYQCPDGSESPGTWHYDATPTVTEGQVACGIYKGAADITWTRAAELLVLTVEGYDMNGLYQWWQRYGNPM